MAKKKVKKNVVKGVGEKRATGLLQQYGSIEGIYEHIDELKGKRRQNLEEHREAAFLSQWLGRGEKALDLGCGAGRTAVALARLKR